MEKQNKNTNKITDKAFSRLMLTSVFSILVCVICLCSATWAWFSVDLSSNSNTLSSGHFALNVSVKDSESNDIDWNKNENGVMTYALTKDETYTVTLTATDDTTVKKGYCIITVNGEPYVTDSIYVDSRDSFSFTVEVTEDNTDLSFEAVWGLPAYSEVEQIIKTGATLTVGEAQNNEN